MFVDGRSRHKSIRSCHDHGNVNPRKKKKRKLQSSLKLAPSRVSVFMPARNEEENIERNLKVLLDGLNSRKIDHLILVIDGPTDSTTEKACNLLELNSSQRERIQARDRATLKLPSGVLLIHHKEPMGKGRAFMEAVFSLYGHTDHFSNPNSTLVNIDADVLDLKLEAIQHITEDLLGGFDPMVLGRVVEEEDGFFYDDFGHGTLHSYSNWFRAIRSCALEPLLKLDEKWVRTLPAGFGMDAALNILVYPHIGLNKFGKVRRGKDYQSFLKPPEFDVVLHSASPHRHQSQEKQCRERQEAVKRRFSLPFSRISDDRIASLAFSRKAANIKARYLKKRAG